MPLPRRRSLRPALEAGGIPPGLHGTILTNVEVDHLDHYGSVAALEDAFVEFTAGLPVDGVCVACADHPRLAALLPRIERRIVRYGLDSPITVTMGSAALDEMCMFTYALAFPR